jgi:uncharacterized FlaG/YvyC family protein
MNNNSKTVSDKQMQRLEKYIDAKMETLDEIVEAEIHKVLGDLYARIDEIKNAQRSRGN